MRDELILAFRSFELLSRDYKEILEYVHPDHLNLDVHSHRIFGLLLRACTDFESLCKAAAKKLQIHFDQRNARINSLFKSGSSGGDTDLFTEVRTR